MNIAPLDKELLRKLRHGQHVKGNPVDARALLEADWGEADAASRRLRDLGWVKSQMDPTRPAVNLIRLTDQGRAQADIIIASERAPTIRERLKAIPFGKGAWDVIKIIGGFALGYFFKGSTG